MTEQEEYEYMEKLKTMTDEELVKEFEHQRHIHEVHDYILFKENGGIFATISSTEAELNKIVEEVYKSKKSIYAFLGYEMPHTIKAHRTYTDEETIFHF